jgi:GNAT superfamily N-acetyltransferase
MIETERLVLVPISPAPAARIVAGEPGPDELWHPQYPFVDELDPLRAHPAATEGRVELGYGLVAAARGRGYATEALRAAVATAREHGARSVAADTDLDNLASQGVLRKAGFAEIRRDDRLMFFSLALPEGASNRA